MKQQTQNQINHNLKQKEKREAKRNKICIWCNVSWFDKTKRLIAKTCSKECAKKYAVSKRKQKGSYVRTEEQNKKMIETMQKLGHIKYADDNKKKFVIKLKQNWQDSEYREMMRLSTEKKYGIHHTKTRQVKEKIKETCLKKYGHTSPTRSDAIKEKIRKTRLEKGLTKTFEGQTMHEWAEKLGCSYSYFKQIVNEKGFEAAKLLSPDQTIIEKVISSWLELNKISYTYNKFLPLETNHQFRPDFFLEEKKIIIECDGLFWHSDAIKNDRNYHASKQNFYSENGYRGLFFRSDELLEKSDIVKSIISNALKLPTIKRIFARKTEIKLLSTTESNEWFEKNHLMGSGRGFSVGLIYNNEIVAAIRITNKTKTNEIEIARFATALNTSVIGGFTKLLNYTINLFKPEIVTTFIDKRYGLGNYLETFGFEKESCYTSFSWTNGEKSIHRLKYPGNSGYSNKLNKIWDCGQQKWIKKIYNNQTNS